MEPKVLFTRTLAVAHFRRTKKVDILHLWRYKTNRDSTSMKTGNLIPWSGIKIWDVAFKREKSIAPSTAQQNITLGFTKIVWRTIRNPNQGPEKHLWNINEYTSCQLSHDTPGAVAATVQYYRNAICVQGWGLSKQEEKERTIVQNYCKQQWFNKPNTLLYLTVK